MGYLSDWIFKKDIAPIEERKIPNPNCKHFNAKARGGDPSHMMWCKDCECPVYKFEVLNNWIDELHGIRKQLGRE